MTSNRRIGLVYPTGHLYVAPAVQAAVELLAQHEYVVDIMMVRNIRSSQVRFKDPKVRVHYFPWIQRVTKEPRVLLVLLFFFWVLFRQMRQRSDFLLAFGERGLLATVIVSMLVRVPFAYYCLELVFEKEHGRLRKTIEQWANRRAQFTIIQDELRASLLVQEHGVPASQIVTVPNARAGKALQRQSRYLQARFPRVTDKLVVLYAGGMTDVALVRELVSSAQEWPDAWVLVVHSGIIYDQSYLQEVMATDKKNIVVFSLSPISIEEMDDLVSSADMGVALYDRGISLDYENIGLASGKIAQYLRNGVPIIVNDVPSLQRIVDDFQVGAAVKNETEMLSAIEAVARNHAIYVRNSLVCYDELFSPDRYFEEVIRRIERVSYRISGEDV